MVLNLSSWALQKCARSKTTDIHAEGVICNELAEILFAGTLEVPTEHGKPWYELAFKRYLVAHHAALKVRTEALPKVDFRAKQCRIRQLGRQEFHALATDAQRAWTFPDEPPPLVDDNGELFFGAPEKAPH